MNVKQQLNNSFFALFVGALLIGARDVDNFKHIDIPRGIFFFFLFFFRLKVYLDDNNNFKEGGSSSQRIDFIFGYVTTMMSWVIFPVAAYRMWDVSLNATIIFLAISIALLSLWTISAAFFTKPYDPMHKTWFVINLAYLIVLGGLYIINNYVSTWFCHSNDGFVNFLSILMKLILWGILYYDYSTSKSLETIKNHI